MQPIILIRPGVVLSAWCLLVLQHTTGSSLLLLWRPLLMLATNISLRNKLHTFLVCVMKVQSTLVIFFIVITYSSIMCYLLYAEDAHDVGNFFQAFITM